MVTHECKIWEILKSIVIWRSFPIWLLRSRSAISISPCIYYCYYFTLVCVCVFMYLYFLRKMIFKQGDDVGLLIGLGGGGKYIQSYNSKVLLQLKICLLLFALWVRIKLGLVSLHPPCGRIPGIRVFITGIPVVAQS